MRHLYTFVAALWAAAGIFLLYRGLTDEPRNTMYLVLGIVFLLFAVMRFRGRRRYGDDSPA